MTIGWKEYKCAELFEQVSTTKLKVKTKDCNPIGKYPVVDQGREKLAGFIDDEKRVISVSSPVCIFGDHTRVIKWIDFDFVPGADGTKILSPKSIINPRFFYYLLQNIPLIDKGYARHFKQLKEASVRVPEKTEQKRIADKLDSVLAKVEAAQARLDKIPAILKRFRQSVLAAATSGELTREWREEHGVDIDDWKQSTLSEVSICLDPNPSHRYPKADSSGVPILSTQQFVGLDSWTTEKSKLVSRDFFHERKEKTKFLEDDIIFARKGRLGLARMAPKGFDYVYSHTVFIVRASGINKEYLLWLLRQEETVNWLLKEMNSNTGVPTLGKAIFEKLPVPLPCEKEQVAIVDKVSELFEHAETVEKQYNAAKIRLDKLTQSILAKAFRGELVS